LSLVRLGIRVRADRAETALARLLPILQAGAEEREVDGAVEYALYGAEGGLPRHEEIRALAGDALVEVRVEPVDAGWEVRFHEHLQSVRAGEFVVRPPWIEGSPDDLVIDPGPFFGAGTHATTRLCLELLQECAPSGTLCDWGAGTGVLAIAAARLGWGPVTAVEVEPGAVEVIRANAARNGVEVEAVACDVRVDPPAASTVVANLPTPVLVEAARPVERVIASGMLAAEADDVVAAFGLRERRRVEADGWAAVMLA
jgi:ribosomal protein L11 methyltransferase